MVEEARLESVYTPKGYRGFESRSLRNFGLVVQLYRTSDSGSEGRGLESRRGHKVEFTILGVSI